MGPNILRLSLAILAYEPIAILGFVRYGFLLVFSAQTIRFKISSLSLGKKHLEISMI